jgi:hypothetical protein
MMFLSSEGRSASSSGGAQHILVRLSSDAASSAFASGLVARGALSPLNSAAEHRRAAGRFDDVNSVHETTALTQLMRTLASDAAFVAGGDTFVASVLPVLTPDGVRLVMRAFLQPFRIAVETSCRQMGGVEGDQPYNASKYREICNTDPKLWTKDLTCPKVTTGQDWCTKFAAEWTIPSIIENSPWAATADSRIDAMVVQADGLCNGPYKNVFDCVRRLATSPPKRSPGPAKTFHFFMYDHGPCDIEGLPDENGFDAQSPAWASPIISVNGERWSTSASQPCHNPHRDIVRSPTIRLLENSDVIVDNALCCV